jgi:ketosteroid isomerase-like protein
MRTWLPLLLFLVLTAARAEEPARAWTYDSRSPSTQREEPGQPTETQQIVALLAHETERWNAHDLDGYMEGLWNSPDLLTVVEGEEIMGWSNILATYQRGYVDRAAMGTVSVERTIIQPTNDNVAFAMEWWRATFPGAKSHSVYATTTYFLRKFPQQGWKIAAAHTSFVEP